MVSSTELRDSRLRLELKTRNCGVKTYNLQWMIRDFRLLVRDTFYSGPRLEIGKVKCEFKCFTSPIRFPNESLEKCVYLGLVPCPTFSRVTITILSPDGSTQFGDKDLLELAPFLLSRGRYFAFQVANNTADLVALCTVVTDLQDDGNFICKAVCAEERCTMPADMELLLKNEKFCDIYLIAGGRTFKAHKAILYARSTYFAEILRNDDPQELMEVIADIDSGTFEELLCYIYTQKTKKYSLEMALKLMPLSVKFQLENLRLFLIDHLVGCMSVDYALLLVVHAHKQQDMEIQSCALECIGNNLEAALEHKDWKDFRNYKELVDQLFHYVAKRIARPKEFVQNP